jgi:phenylpropionate dioxygenase-like ring-hydroxylating dioxygenase large terminal subunit
MARDLTEEPAVAAGRTGVARGLPNGHYVDPAVWEAERQRVLFGAWSGLCLEADVASPGDARPLSFADVPLFVIRGRDGAVRVFQNVCRHRGMILVAEPRRIEGAIRCPYHSWCYDHDGALRATPHVGGPGVNRAEGIVREELGLIEVPSAVWRGVVWINVDGRAGPFADWAASLAARWDDVDGPFVPEGRFTLDVACNWKLAVENYCESYHLPWVHPGLNAYSRLEDHYTIEAEGFSGQGTHAYNPDLRFADWPDLGSRWDRGAEYVALFPNVLLGQHRDHAFAIVLEPVAPGRTREHVAIQYAAPPDPAAATRNAAQWREVFEEDVFVVEGMQQGRHAPGFDGGRFSPAMDGATRAFHAWVAGRMA